MSICKDDVQLREVWDIETLPFQGCKGLCCGPVPVTERELKKIRKKIRSMPVKMRLALENQKRYYGTCIFYDLNNDRCGIYSDRPEICRVFGSHKNLVCFLKPEFATKGTWSTEETHVGILRLDITWKDFN